MSNNEKKGKYLGYARFATREQAMSKFDKLAEECEKYVEKEQIQRDREYLKATYDERRKIIEQTSYVNAVRLNGENNTENRGETVIRVAIADGFRESDLIKLKEKMEGQTYFQYHLSWEKHEKCCALYVESDRPYADEEELRDMFIYSALVRLANA